MITYTQQSFDRIYSARLFTLSTCFCMVAYFGIIVMPFVLAFATNNFWITTVKLSEQPTITLRNEYYVAVLLDDQKYFYSNIQKFENQDPDSQLTGAEIKSSHQDQNSDGKDEQINVNIKFRNSADKVQKIIAIIFLDCEFPDLKFKMRSMFMIDESSELGISGMHVYGTTNFIQSSPISKGQQLFKVIHKLGTFKTICLIMTPLSITTTIYLMSSKNTILEIVRQSITYPKVQLVPNYQIQKIPGNGQLSTEISINLLFDQQQIILVKPSFLGMVKQAWLQYFSIFIPILMVGESLLRFLFRFRFLNSHISNNIPLQIKEF